jgi:hypothetical protein
MLGYDVPIAAARSCRQAAGIYGLAAYAREPARLSITILLSKHRHLLFDVGLRRWK